MKSGRIVLLLLVGIAAWVAVALQVVLAARVVAEEGRPPLIGVINALSYFTVLTNLLVAIVATAAASRRGSGTFFGRPSTMSATTVYIFVVWLVYSLLLRALWEPTGLQRVADVALHGVIPLLYIPFWCFYVPKGTLKWDLPPRWLIYPAAYAVYSLLYGALTGRYLYPFADVGALGYPAVLVNTVVFLGGFLVLGSILVAIDRLVCRTVQQAIVAGRARRQVRGSLGT